MKTISLISVFLILTVAHGKECNQCESAVKTFGQYLLTDTKMNDALALFKENLCTIPALVESCSFGIDNYWPNMAQAIFNYPSTPYDICNMNDQICDQSIADCDSCELFIAEIEQVFADPDFMKRAHVMMSGPLFCDKADNKDDCNQFVKSYGYRAMPLAGRALQHLAAENCAAVLGVSKC